MSYQGHDLFKAMPALQCGRSGRAYRSSVTKLRQSRSCQEYELGVAAYFKNFWAENANSFLGKVLGVSVLNPHQYHYVGYMSRYLRVRKVVVSFIVRVRNCGNGKWQSYNENGICLTRDTAHGSLRLYKCTYTQHRVFRVRQIISSHSYDYRACSQYQWS